MKDSWAVLLAFSLVSVGVVQTASTSGSASSSTSVGPGQASAGASANQSVQAPGAPANTAASGNAQVSHDQKSSQHGNSKAQGSAAGSANSSAAAGNTAALAEGSMLHTELAKSLDAKKCKPGDEVTAKVTEDFKSNGKVVVHKGSKVIGHVTESEARSKEHANSTLGIAFDKVVAKGGEEMAFHGVIQAIAPPAQAMLGASADQSAAMAAPAGAGMSGGGGSRGGLVGGVAGGAVSSVGSTAGVATNTVGSAGGAVGGTVGGATRGLSAQGALMSTSQGAIGLPGLSLNSVSSAAAQGSVITSPTQNVKLDSGTQMLLRAGASAQ